MIKGWGVTTRNVKASITYYARVAGQAERYYRQEQDHVLGEDQEIGESATLLFGAERVLRALDLVEGEVDTRIVTALASGSRPGAGEILVRARTGVDPATGEPWHRRCYYDFALSVPQSYSTAFAAALASGDAATADAMRVDLTAAAVASYRAMEDTLAIGRRGHAGSTKITAHAPFLANLHSTSRPVAGRTHGDPTLHVHLRVINIALGTDGQWGAVDYKPIWSGVRTWSALFESDLQARVLARGGETTVVERGSRNPWASWELMDRSVPLDEAFSTRSSVVAGIEARLWQSNAVELLARIQADDVAGGEPARQALTPRQWEAARPSAGRIDAEVRRTREKKGPTTRRQLLEEWRERIEQHSYRHRPYDGVDRRFGITCDVPAETADILRARARNATVEQIAADLLAPTGLTASRAVWTRPELAEAVSAALVPAQLGVDDAREIMRRVEARAVAASLAAGGQPVWTTAELLADEHEWASYLTGLARQPGHLSVSSIDIEGAIAREAKRARSAGRGDGLDAEQRLAVASALDGHGFTAIVGDAGSGKTTTARVVVDALRRAGYSPIGLAMSGSAAEVLQAETGVKSWNVRDFLTRHEYGVLLHDFGPRTAVLLDEAGTVDDRTLAELTRVLRDAPIAGLIAIGDDRQAQPIGAGAPLAWLRRTVPDRVARLTVNYRQGEHRGDTRGDRALLLREGDGRAYLEALDRSGQLIVTRTTDDAVAALTARWTAAIAGGADVRDHVGVCNLNDTRDQLNEAFRAAYEQLGRLGEGVLLPGGRPLARGDRVSFNAPFRELTLDGRGNPTPRRTRRGRVIPGGFEVTGERAPNRARATVVGLDLDRQAVLVATDGTQELPSRTLLLRGVDAARILDYAYCLTTNISQGMTVAATYALGDVSRITGASTAYVQATRDSREHWLAISAEASRTDPLAADWRSSTMTALVKAISRQQQVMCALDYFGTPAADDSPTEAVGREMRRHERALELLMSPPTQAQLDQLVALGHPIEETRDWTLVRALTVAEEAAGLVAGSTLRSWLAATHGEDRAERWVDEALRASGAPGKPVSSASARAIRHATPTAAALAALSMPATVDQIEDLAHLDVHMAEGVRWNWARASIELDLARGALFPGREVVEWLSANSVSPARAAAEVNRVLIDHGARLEPEGAHANGRRPYFRVVSASGSADDEHMLRIERLINSEPGTERLDAVHEYTCWLAAHNQATGAAQRSPEPAHALPDGNDPAAASEAPRSAPDTSPATTVGRGAGASTISSPRPPVADTVAEVRAERIAIDRMLTGQRTTVPTGTLHPVLAGTRTADDREPDQEELQQRLSRERERAEETRGRHQNAPSIGA